MSKLISWLRLCALRPRVQSVGQSLNNAYCEGQEARARGQRICPQPAPVHMSQSLCTEPCVFKILQHLHQLAAAA